MSISEVEKNVFWIPELQKSHLKYIFDKHFFSEE